MRQPGDRVRLARPGRVLHQVVAAGAVLAGFGGEREHGVPLVEPREDHRRLSGRALRRRLHVYESDHLGVDSLCGPEQGVAVIGSTCGGAGWSATRSGDDSPRCHTSISRNMTP